LKVLSTLITGVPGSGSPVAQSFSAGTFTASQTPTKSLAGSSRSEAPDLAPILFWPESVDDPIVKVIIIASATPPIWIKFLIFIFFSVYLSVLLRQVGYSYDSSHRAFEIDTFQFSSNLCRTIREAGQRSLKENLKKLKGFSKELGEQR
jgi:hypothetical protein